MREINHVHERILAKEIHRGTEAGNIRMIEIAIIRATGLNITCPSNAEGLEADLVQEQPTAVNMGQVRHKFQRRRELGLRDRVHRLKFESTLNQDLRDLCNQHHRVLLDALLIA